MTPQKFVAKYAQIQQKETAVSQSHFNDIGRLVGHPTPLKAEIARWARALMAWRDA